MCDIIEFTKKVSTNYDIIHYIKQYFDENAAMYGLVDICGQGSKIAAINGGDCIIYKISPKRKNQINTIITNIQNKILNIYGRTYQINIQVFDDKALTIFFKEITTNS